MENFYPRNSFIETKITETWKNEIFNENFSVFVFIFKWIRNKYKCIVRRTYTMRRVHVRTTHIFRICDIHKLKRKKKKHFFLFIIQLRLSKKKFVWYSSFLLPIPLKFHEKEAHESFYFDSVKHFVTDCSTKRTTIKQKLHTKVFIISV